MLSMFQLSHCNTSGSLGKQARRGKDYCFRSWVKHQLWRVWKQGWQIKHKETRKDSTRCGSRGVDWVASQPPLKGSFKLEIKRGNKATTETILSQIAPISFCQVNHLPFENPGSTTKYPVTFMKEATRTIFHVSISIISYVYLIRFLSISKPVTSAFREVWLAIRRICYSRSGFRMRVFPYLSEKSNHLVQVIHRFGIC